FGTAITYAIGWSFWGNPNSTGAVIGVLVTPFLLWGLLIPETSSEKYRLSFELLICCVLLYVALSRAGVLAALISCAVLCLCLRRQRLLWRGAFVISLLVAFAAV